MGRAAASLLLARILNPGSEPQRVLLPTIFSARGSTGPAKDENGASPVRKRERPSREETLP